VTRGPAGSEAMSGSSIAELTVVTLS
jgi:hypothetical protein